MTVWRRRLLAAAVIGALLAGTVACDPEGDTLRVQPRVEPQETHIVQDPAEAAATSSAASFEASDIVFLAPEESAGDLMDNSEEAGVPLLLIGAQITAAELERLGAHTLVIPEGVGSGDLAEAHTVIEVDPVAETSAFGLPPIEILETAPQAVAVVDPHEEGSPAVEIASANVRAVGGSVLEIPGGDPRLSIETVEAARQAESASVVAIGESFGTPEELAERISHAASAPQLPGGGQLAFPGRRMVAAYGSPGIPSLGILGEQGIEETIARVKRLAEEYQPHSEEPVIPAFEIITTVASASAGADGNHSTELDVETLRPWIEAAGEEGVYVVLDLQPGTSDFLSQARLYEDLLKEPHVGLALDPEWRLEEGQRHLQQIGSVSAAEINETADWLAELTRSEGLPQKVFILHQFSRSMITDREDIDAGHEELAMTLHADGHGTPGMKLETWRVLQEDLPEGIWMAWKNFYDEDTPTFTPEETYDVEPRPWFVSYQ